MNGISIPQTIEPPPDQKFKVVNCLSCRKEVEVQLISYGGGHIAMCPACGELAYSGK